MLHSAYGSSGIGCVEDGTPCHENICAGGKQVAGVFYIHAAVHFNEGRQVAAGYLGADIAYLVHCVGDEGLSAEACEDGHKEDHIHFIQIRVESVYVDIGIDSEAGAHVLGADE